MAGICESLCQKKEKKMKILQIAIKNILKHPGKNILVALMVFLATSIFLFTSSITASTQKAFREFLGTTTLGYYNVGVQKGIKKDYTSPTFDNNGKYVSQNVIKYLDDNKINYSKRIRAGGVKYNFETQKFDGAENGCNIIGTNIEKEFTGLTNLNIVEGKYDENIENGALVWKQLMVRYKWKVGDEISFFINGIDGNPQPYSFIITGVVTNKTGNNLEVEAEHVTSPVIFVKYDFLERVLGYDAGECSEVAIWERDVKKLTQIKTIAEADKNYAFYAEGGYALIESINGLVKFMGYFIGIFILAVLVISTFNINLMGFMERQKEIGTMLAIGAKPGWTIKLLVAEMIMFSVAAFVLSLGLYGGICAATSGGVDIGELGIMIAGAKLKMDIIWGSVATTFAAIIGAMAVSAVYPIYLTSKLNPVEVFREGEM